MGKFKKSFYLFIGTCSLLILAQCTRYQEIAPFFDGLKLEYKLSSKAKLIYDVQAMGSDRFKIIEMEKRRVLKDKIQELLVDAHGRVFESSLKDYVGGFSPIWIPVHELKVGDTFDGEYEVVRQDKWRKWAVLVVKDSIVGFEQYYDINTGFKVGIYGKSRMGAVTVVLINSNANIPTIEE